MLQMPVLYRVTQLIEPERCIQFVLLCSRMLQHISFAYADVSVPGYFVLQGSFSCFFRISISMQVGVWVVNFQPESQHDIQSS